jgi:hypothetical protein
MAAMESGALLKLLKCATYISNTFPKEEVRKWGDIAVLPTRETFKP